LAIIKWNKFTVENYKYTIWYG